MTANRYAPELYTAAEAAKILRVKQSWLERQAAACGKSDRSSFASGLKNGSQPAIGGPSIGGMGTCTHAVPGRICGPCDSRSSAPITLGGEHRGHPVQLLGSPPRVAQRGRL